MKSDNKAAVFGLVAVIVIALGAVVYMMTSGGTSSTDLYQQNKAEMQKSVPAGLETITPEKASEGAVMMGGKKNSAPAQPQPTAPPGR
jgi:hypothetical protein